MCSTVVGLLFILLPNAQLELRTSKYDLADMRLPIDSAEWMSSLDSEDEEDEELDKQKAATWSDHRVGTIFTS